MTKRTILTLPEEALNQADQLASELHVSRAEFFRRALSAYAEELRKQKQELETRRQKEEAFRETENLRKRYGHIGKDGPESTQVIREWRDRDRLTRMYERQEEQRLHAREKDEEQ